MAGRTFSFRFGLNGSNETETLILNRYVEDVSDGGTDSLVQLGDVNPETFTAQGSTYNYLGVASGGNGIIGEIGGTRYLFTQTYYSQYSTIYYSAGQYALCFTSGAQIETSRGPIEIEKLSVGDTAVTAFGSQREIIWIGKRTLDCSGENAHMAPIKVRADAFGAGVPERDVLLSPGHPVLVRQNGVEVLVPIMNLINGTTIERTSMRSVTYWHVELDQHDVLLADGLPAESFFDMGSRCWFDHDLDDVLANPDLVPAGQHGRCRDVAIDGPLVEAERKRLADLFYADLSAQCVWPTAGEYTVA